MRSLLAFGFLLLSFFLPVTAQAAVVSGDSCTTLGLSQLSEFRNDLVVCVFIDKHADGTACSASYPCRWKSMSGGSGSSGSVCGVAVMYLKQTTILGDSHNFNRTYYPVSDTGCEGTNILTYSNLKGNGSYTYSAPSKTCPSGYKVVEVPGKFMPATPDTDGDGETTDRYGAGSYYTSYNCVKE